MRNLSISLLILLIAASNGMAQRPSPAPNQEKPILILGGTAHTGDGTVITNAAVAFENGKLTLVEGATKIRIDQSNYDLIELDEGDHIYPGFILPNTILGLTEVNSVRATRDFNEQGQLNSNVRSIIAYNTDSEIIPTLRFNGVLLAQVTPQGGLISGTSSIVQLDAWNWEDASYLMDDGIHMNWPPEKLSPRWWLGETEYRENKKYDSLSLIAEQFMMDAKGYASINNPKTKNLKLEATKGLFDGSKQLFIHVNSAKSIVTSVKMAQRNGVKKVVLVGASDILPVIDFVKENNIPVILNDVHSLPIRNGASVDYSYELAAKLNEAGILYCLDYSGAANSRNLPFYAGTTVAFGLNKEDALASITSKTAEILGISDRTGMLKGGLDANLIISEGDVLDMKTSKIKKAFIRGREITLAAKQQKLYEMYKAKYEGE
ncbi:MAG: amidohydrolase [Bacteroidota bacterium]